MMKRKIGRPRKNRNIRIKPNVLVANTSERFCNILNKGEYQDKIIKDCIHYATKREDNEHMSFIKCVLCNKLLKINEKVDR